MSVDYKATIKAVVTNETIAEAASELNISVTTLHSRIYTLKKHGIVLRRPARVQIFDAKTIKDLKEYARSLK